MIDVKSLERAARWRGLPEEASGHIARLLVNERRSGVREVEFDVFVGQRPIDDSPRAATQDVAPEIFAFGLGLVISVLVAIVALATGEPGAAIVMVAPAFAAIIGLGFIGYTSRQR